MRRKYDRSKFIKILEEAPFISYAARKAGIAKATIYRWIKSDPEFRSAVNRALDSGRDQLIDIAEMALIDKIKTKDLGAIKFFLQHNNERYRPVRTAYVPPKHLEAEPLSCETCEVNPYKNMSEEELDRRTKEMLEAIENGRDD